MQSRSIKFLRPAFSPDLCVRDQLSSWVRARDGAVASLRPECRPECGPEEPALRTTPDSAQHQTGPRQRLPWPRPSPV